MPAVARMPSAIGLETASSAGDHTQDRQAGPVGVPFVVGNFRELREVIALVECGRLTPMPLEFWPLDQSNEAYDGLKRGKAAGRAVLMP